MVRTAGRGFQDTYYVSYDRGWSLGHPADTDFHDHAGHHRQVTVGGQVPYLVCEGQVSRLMVVPDSGEYAPLMAESIEDSYVLWDIKAVTLGPSTLLLA